MADKIVAEYTVKVDKALKDLDKLAGKVDKIDDNRKKTEKGFAGMSSSLSSSFAKVGAAIGLAFGTQQLVSFGKEAVTLASQLEGVERAFKRIGGANSANLLNGLRTATRGTVSDLILMQKAVQASNFKIPLENLASLFKFAQARARETGESVEYLTNSIVLGIGRKSPLILDNLGISAVELRERLKGVGVEAANVGDIAQIIGDIAEEELAKMGDQADTTADKLAQLNIIGENLKVGLGEALINLGTGFAFLAGQIDGIDVNLTGAEKAAKSLAKTFSGDVVGATEMMLKKNQELLESQLKIAELEETRTYQNSREAIANINEAIEKEKERQEFLREYIKQLKLIYDASIKVDEVQKEQIRNVFFLKKAIEDLTDEVNSEGVSREKIAELLPKIKALEEELARLLGKETAEMKKLREELELNAKLRAQVFTGAEMAEGIPVVTLLSSTLNELNLLLKEQNEILDTSPEFSKRYKEASKEVDKLKKKIDSFNDDFIDPSLGNPNVAPGAPGSATGLGLFGDGEGDEPTDLEKFEAYANAVKDIVSGITDAVTAGHKAELASLESQLNAGQITREQYDEKRRKLERKSAIAAKNAAIFQAVINTALAVSNALNTVPFLPLGPVMAGIAAGLGAVQIGVIAGTPLPQFAEGGWVDSKGKIHGNSHAQGGVKIEAEGDEFIVKGKHAKKNSGLLEALNAGSGQEWINKNMVYPAIQNVLDNGDSNSNQWNNLNVQFKDHNLISAMDRDRQANVRGLSMVNNTLNKLVKTQKRGGYHA